ncbi:hypothetical protein [Methylobacter sp. S3L5C]|uniref:hypothetical protein n=1 Tax=Methylobacter sp. S3L5C TaxID=2839024 RepID=UPI001FADD029|nr:hypothetical protein [Methylobacter sp. S3L5C]UOA07291.1 hypothetical protein KKZ03_13430 [Methylobacter sp. S3L5C]
MKQITAVFMVIALIGLMTGNPVWAHGGGGGHYGGGYGGGGHYGGGHYYGHGYYNGYYYGGLGLGLGLGYGLGYYGNPYYVYPPAVIAVPTAPPVYIQQAPPVVQQNPSGYWYYCNNPQGYYPSIKECLGGWQQVAPILPR